MSSHQLRSLLLLALAAVVLHQGSVHAEASLLEDTCKNVANKTSFGVEYEFCVTSLQVDPRTRTASNASVLGAVAVDLSVANATNAQTKIKSLLDSSKVDPTTKNLLNQCKSSYDEMLTLFGGASKDLAAKSYKDASAKLSSGAGKPEDCDELLLEAAKSELLGKENDNCYKLATISDIVVSTLS